MDKRRIESHRQTDKKDDDNVQSSTPERQCCRLYVPRKEGGRGLISIEDCVDIAELSLKEYVMRSKEKIIPAARGKVTKEVESAKAYKKRRKEERETSVWEKELHGQHFRQTKEVVSVSVQFHII